MTQAIAPSVTVEQAVKLLNELVALDRDAIEMLVQSRVRCNEALADHPSVKVGDATDEPGPADKPYRVGLLGILACLFGARPDGWSWIAAIYEVVCQSDHGDCSVAACGHTDYRLRKAQVGEPCPECKAPLALGHLIEFVVTPDGGRMA